MDYFLPESLNNKKINIAVVGVGGTGGEVIDCLTRLHFGLQALGGQGIHVTAYDNDIVMPSNIGRQRFSVSDSQSKQYKSICLIHRTNMFYGTDFEAEPRHFNVDTDLDGFDIVIGCVDKASFRAELGLVAQQQEKHHSHPLLWLDMGNGQYSGQCVLGHVYKGFNEPLRLPTVFDLYPSLSNPELDNDDAPRCSLAEALQHQDLFINSTLATFGMNILWELFTKGKLSHHGLIVNTQTLSCSPMMIDTDAWAFYGYHSPKIKNTP